MTTGQTNELILIFLKNFYQNYAGVTTVLDYVSHKTRYLFVIIALEEMII